MAVNNAIVKNKSLIVWNFQDGKAGHENQAAGLLLALSQLVKLEVVNKKPLRFMQAATQWFFKRVVLDANQRPPDIILGTGHATHLTVLAAARSFSAGSIILMKPSLPMSWFDLCFVPEHDNIPNSSVCITTRGVLNKIEYCADKRDSTGLLLIGGPSRHYQWDDEKIFTQLREIVEHDVGQWTLTTSRRTPDSFLSSIPDFLETKIKIVPIEQTEPGWLPTQLSVNKVVWVSEDSVSMLYEALSSGAACGLLSVPSAQKRSNETSKIKKGVSKLVSEGLVVEFSQWRKGSKLKAPTTRFNETERCARIIFERWLKKN